MVNGVLPSLCPCRPSSPAGKRHANQILLGQCKSVTKTVLRAEEAGTWGGLSRGCLVWSRGGEAWREASSAREEEREKESRLPGQHVQRSRGRRARVNEAGIRPTWLGEGSEELIS